VEPVLKDERQKNKVKGSSNPKQGELLKNL
jgi:hypothetical protein